MRTSYPLAIVATTTLVAVVILTSLASSSRSQDAAVPPIPVPGDPSVAEPELPMPPGAEAAPEGAEVLTRGPVHEAFASPTLLDPEAGPVINKQPPEPIEEIPPDERPEGDNVIWIPGYWAWDDERNDFLWISGLYRNAPPNQTWVTGYWSDASGGYQWTPGFWTAAAQGEVSYLEEAPPATLEAGPSSPAPSENHFWIPGCWMYQDVRYAWRPGYWAMAQPNWVWVPARYTWCPTGYVFVNGYWDFEPISRGCLFAPVYFTQPIYVQPAFVYRPAVVINTGFFTANLFTRPSYCHYYFGDYFAAGYSNFGYRPWFAVNIGGRRPFYDPFFTYYSCHNRRHDRDWLVRTERRYNTLRHDEHARPPHTFASLQRAKSRDDRSRRDDVVIAKTLKEVKNDRGGNIKLREVDRTDREKFVRQASELKKVRKQRVEIEKKPTIAKTSRDLDRDRTDRAKSSAKVAAKKLKLPEVATSKIDASPRNRGDSAGRALDAAKKNDKVERSIDRSPRTSTPRVVDSDKQQTPKTDLKSKDTERARTAITTPRGGDVDADRRRTVRTQSDNAADAARKAVDRARSSVGRGTTGGPALNQPDVIRRQATSSDAAKRRSTTGGADQFQRRSVNRSPIDALPRGSTTVTPRGSTTTEPRSRIVTPPKTSEGGRSLRSTTPQMVVPRSSSQLKSDSGGGRSSSGSSSGSKNKGSDESERSRRRGRSADATSPRSNFDLSVKPPTISNLPDKVEDELKARRGILEGPKDDLADQVREVVRGEPLEGDRGTTADAPNRRESPHGDLRVPPLYGPAAPLPNQRGLTQSETTGPALRSDDGNRTGGDASRPEFRRGFGVAESEPMRNAEPSNSATPRRELSEGARPGRNPLSRYDSLMQQGRTLSRGTIERPGTVDEAGNVDPRKLKDPIGKIGYGATPKRFGAPRMYGPLGQPSGSSDSAAAETKPRGGGSFIDPTERPRWQSSPLPQLQRMQRNAPPPRSFNPSDRTYDPTRGY